MKSVRPFFKAILIALAVSLFFQCSSSKYQLEETASINPKQAYFLEWYAGIKVGGSGFNIYFPNLNGQKNVVVDSVFFRRMKAKLIEGRSRYTAVLKNSSKHYADISKQYQAGNKKLDKAANFPFQLKENECVISYLENGETKYLKITNLKEKQSLYYEKGAPLVITD